MSSADEYNLSISSALRVFTLWGTAGEKVFLRRKKQLSARREFQLRQINHHGILATFGFLPTITTSAMVPVASWGQHWYDDIMRSDGLHLYRTANREIPITLLSLISQIEVQISKLRPARMQFD